MKKFVMVTGALLLALLPLFGAGEQETKEAEVSGAVPERAMRILIINDDGYEAEGFQILGELLEEEGYEVWSVGPTTNQSGIGTAIRFSPGKPKSYAHIRDNHYHFDGTPSDCFTFAVSALMSENPPDLVISGVNDGPNVGVAQMNSGTVGGAIRAAKHGYPAIASSIGFRMEEMSEGFPSTMKYIPDAAAFTVKIVNKLAEKWKQGMAIMPEGIALSINYPAYPVDEIKGIAFPSNRLPAPHQFVFQLKDETTAVTVPSEHLMSTPEAEDPSDDENMIFFQYITIEPLDASWHAPKEISEAIESSFDSWNWK